VQIEIFLSYRRADAAGSAGRLSSSLSQHFGAARVFRDIDSIEAGDNFEHAIRDAVETAAAVLVVIGPRWLELRATDGTRRIDDPLDYVRREIELALASDTIIIPVLVESAALPTAELLPQTIRELTKRNAVELSDKRWDHDVQNLIKQLESRGIAAAEVSQPEVTSTKPVSYRDLTASLAEFVPNLFLLLRQPRRFLRRCATGRAADLTRAFVFFTVTVLLAVSILLSAYTPRQSMVSFGLTVFILGLLATVALSAPLWIAWRLVGATRHYLRLLVILLHQAAILHLAMMVIMWVILVALDMLSLDTMREIMDEAMKPGSSTSTSFEISRHRLEPLAQASEMRLALAIGALVFLLSVFWTIRSSGAYREAFGLTRIRSAAALIIFTLIAWVVSTLVYLLVSLRL
jgi:TIR domain